MRPMHALGRAATCIVDEDAGPQAAFPAATERQRRADLDFDGIAVEARPRVACITH